MQQTRCLSLTVLGPLTLASLVFAGACGRRFERPALPAFIAKDKKDARVGYSLSAYASDLAKYNAATGEDARKLRDKMVYGLFGEIDYAYYDYQSRLFVDRGSLGVGTDFIQVGLSSAATITGGAHTKSVLAALLSGATGVSLSVDKNFFQQQTVEAILSSMSSARDSMKVTIIHQLAADTNAYPFLAAKSDLVKYFYAGSLPSALQNLHQVAAIQADKKSQELNDMQMNRVPQ